MSKYPTAKEKMDRGEWVLYKNYYKKLSGLYVYIEELGTEENKRYCLHFMEYFTIKGTVVYGSVGIVLKLVRLLLNTIQKGSGDEALGDMIEDIQELKKSRRHNQGTGCSFNRGGMFYTKKDIDEEIKIILPKKEKIKEKKYDLKGMDLG